jgi:ring-1,2-phenylacetyl-CoA epoxidase subunit PaaE
MAGATRTRAAMHPLAVAAVDRVTDDAVAITFDVPQELADAYRFDHGQHLVVVRRDGEGAEEVRRTYSICSPATDGGPLRVAVKRLDGGAFSTWAHEALRPGDVLEVMTPGGRFTTPLDPAHAKHYLLIAAGSGITPLLSIASTVLDVEHGSRVTLLYGNRSTASIMFLEELEDLKDRYGERFVLHHVLSREPREVELLSGRLDGDKVGAFLDRLIAPEDVDECFLCGPLELVEGAREVLVAHGVAPEHVHRELFHVEAAPPPRRAAREGAAPAAERSVTVVLDGRETTFSLSAEGEPVLDALLRVRGDAPYACKGGVCGTCRARCTEGTVTMDHSYALEPGEIDAGYVLACQSHPASERVVLDFDQ